MPYGPRMFFWQLGTKAARVRFTVELSVGTSSGTEDINGAQSSAYQAFYDNDVIGIGINVSDAFFTYDTSLIPSGSTITAAIMRWRTATFSVFGVPTQDIDVKMKNTAGMVYGSGTTVQSLRAQVGNTSYTYTLTSGQYANIAVGAAARTCMVLANASLGVSGDYVLIPFTATSCELEVAWTQP